MLLVVCFLVSIRIVDHLATELYNKGFLNEKFFLKFFLIATTSFTCGLHCLTTVVMYWV